MIASPDYTSLYEVNTITGVSKKLIYRETNDLKRYGDYIYYTSKDDLRLEAIYKYNLKTQDDSRLVSWFSGIRQYDVIKNKVYFTDDDGLLYNVETMESPVRITKGSVLGDQSAPCI